MRRRLVAAGLAAASIVAISLTALQAQPAPMQPQADPRREPQQPAAGQASPVQVRAITAVDNATLELRVSVSAADRDAARALTAKEAAKSAVANAVTDAAFAHADWEKQALAAATIETRAAKEIQGEKKFDAEYTVTVKVLALLKWAESVNVRWSKIAIDESQPELVLMPELRGAWRSPDENESIVAAAIGSFFREAGRDVQLTDGETYLQNRRSMGVEESDAMVMALAGTFQIQVAVRLEKPTATTVRAAVRYKLCLPATAQVLLNDESNSVEVAAAQSTAAVAAAARTAAHRLYTALLANGRAEAKQGPIYQVAFSGVTTQELRNKAEAVVKAIAKDAATVRGQWSKPNYLVMVRVNPQLAAIDGKLERAFNKAVAAENLKLGEFRFAGRLLQAELASK